MEGIDEFLNHLNDLGWWPFASLRPKPDEKMTTDYVGKLALIHGSIAGFVVGTIVIVWVSLQGGPVSFYEAVWVVLTMAALGIVGFLVVYRLTFAVAWNRRAERLLTDPAYGGVLPDEPFDPGAYGTYRVWVPRGPLRRTDDV